MSDKFKVKNGIITPYLQLLNFEQNKPLIVNALGEISTTDQDFWNDADPRLYLSEDIQRCGFVNHTTTSIFFNNTSSPVTTNGQSVPAWSFQLGDISGGSGWVYYLNGTRCIVNGNKTVSLTLDANPPVTGTYFIKIVNNQLGTLSVSSTPWSLTDPFTIPVALISFNNSLIPNYWLANERHTILIDRKIHYILHTTKGAQIVSSGALTGYTVNVDSDTATTFEIGTSIISDEDIIVTNNTLADTNGLVDNYIIYYRTGVDTWLWKKSIVPFPYAPGSYIQYDNNGALTTGINGNFYNTYLLFTNNEGLGRFIMVPGRGAFTTAALALAEDPSTFSWSGLAIAEYVMAYQLTWKTASNYNNTGKVRLNNIPKAINISSVTATSISTAAHNELSGVQGGALNEYYHLTAVEQAYIQSLYLNTFDFKSNSVLLNNLNYLNSVTVSTTVTSSALLYSFSGLIYGSGKFTIQAISGSDIHSIELLVIHSGVTATAVEYAKIFNNVSLFNIEVEKVGDSIRILTNSTFTTLTKYVLTINLLAL